MNYVISTATLVAAVTLVYGAIGNLVTQQFLALAELLDFVNKYGGSAL